MTENVTLYHGSYAEVKKPDLRKCLDGKDFGIGFYTTTDKKQAVKFSKRVARIHSQDYGILNKYDMSGLSGLKVFRFNTTNEEWLNCVVGFRAKRFGKLAEPYRQYDILIGKIADDNTSLVINAYMVGAYGPVGSANAVRMAIENLNPKALKNQIVFRSAASLTRIIFKGSETIWR